MASVLGKMISAEAGTNPSFLAFFRSASSKEEEIQPKACFFVPFFAILDQCTTLLMGMQWRGTRGLREKGERKEEEAVAVAEEQCTRLYIQAKSKKQQLKEIFEPMNAFMEPDHSLGGYSHQERWSRTQ
jgi:hypothetical protein